MYLESEISPPPLPPDYSHDFDIKRYDLNLDISMTDQTLSGYCEVTAIAKSSLGYIILEVRDLCIEGITVDEQQTPWSIEKGKLLIFAQPIITKGKRFNIHISYHCTNTYGMRFNDDVAFSYVQPDYAHYWFPCVDHPSDKADEGCSVTLTVPEGYTGVSNGILTEHTGNTWHWETRHSIATYLIAFVCGRFNRLEGTTRGVDTPAWYLAGDRENMRAILQNLGDILGYFNEAIAPYPFADEKCGFIECPEGSGVENPTLTILDSYMVSNPRENTEWVLSHELAHQWFGDEVTCGDWREMWLNEGFANFYGDSWITYRDKQDAFEEDYIKENYLISETKHRAPLYHSYDTFSFANYYKGAKVLKMLEYQMGKDTFRDVIKSYYHNHQGGNVTTLDLLNACEDVTNQCWCAFFTQWVYRAGFPELGYELHSLPSNPNSVELLIQQTQYGLQTPQVFMTPLDVQLITGNGMSNHKVVLDSRWNSYNFSADSPVLGVVIDPENKLLQSNHPPTHLQIQNPTATRFAIQSLLTWEVAAPDPQTAWSIYRREVKNDKNNDLWTLRGKLPNSDNSTLSFVDDSLDSTVSYEYLICASHPQDGLACCKVSCERCK